MVGWNSCCFWFSWLFSEMLKNSRWKNVKVLLLFRKTSKWTIANEILWDNNSIPICWNGISKIVRERAMNASKIILSNYFRIGLFSQLRKMDEIFLDGIESRIFQTLVWTYAMELFFCELLPRKRDSVIWNSCFALWRVVFLNLSCFGNISV